MLPSQVFLGDVFPWWFSVAGYMGLMVLGTIVIPLLYPAMKWCECGPLPGGHSGKP